MEQALWFASRATGLVSLLLITATVALGASHARRATSSRWPRFTVHAVHRNLSLLTLVFLVVHIASAIVDPYVKIGWLAAVVPFVSPYQPFWLGLGTVAFDLVLAVLVTSIMRLRVPLRLWRVVHTSTYAMWPVAMIHGLGIGGEDRSMWWVLAIDVGCGVAVVVALTRRLLVRDPDARARRAAEMSYR